MDGHFTRSHVGGNNAVHGGMIPLFYDWLVGMVVSTAGCPPTRTAFLHVDYRNITPIDEPLTAQGRITNVDGRKFFIAATMTAADGTLLSEANGLMVRLLPPTSRERHDVRHHNAIHGTRRRESRRRSDSGPRPGDPGGTALQLRTAH